MIKSDPSMRVPGNIRMNVMHPSSKHRLNVRVSWLFTCVSAVAVLLMYGVEVKADPNFSAEQVEYFESKVRPLLVRHCYELSLIHI